MQTTRSPKQGGHPDKQGHPDKHQEPSPQHHPERKSPGREDQDDGRHSDAPRRPGDDKQHEVRKPTNHR